MTEQIFVYNFVTTVVFFGKKKRKPCETSHILKMKTPFEKEQHLENENTF